MNSPSLNVYQSHNNEEEMSETSSQLDFVSLTLSPYYYYNKQSTKPLTKDTLVKKEQLDELLLFQNVPLLDKLKKLERRRSISNGNIARHLYNEDNSQMLSINTPFRKRGSENSDASIQSPNSLFEQSQSQYYQRDSSLLSTNNHESISHKLRSTHSRSVNASSTSFACWSFKHHQHECEHSVRRGFSGIAQLSAAHIARIRTRKLNNTRQHYYNSSFYAIIHQLSEMAARVVNSRATEPVETRLSIDEIASLSQYLDVLRLGYHREQKQDTNSEEENMTVNNEYQGSNSSKDIKLNHDDPIIMENGNAIIYTPSRLLEASYGTHSDTTALLLNDTSNNKRHINSFENMLSSTSINQLPNASETNRYRDDNKEPTERDPLLPSIRQQKYKIKKNQSIKRYFHKFYKYIKRYIEEGGWQQQHNNNNTQVQFEGWSLFIFSPTSWIRFRLWKIIGSRWFEIFIFCLLISQWILLSFIPDLFKSTEKDLTRVADYFLCFINVVYTLELISKIIIYGLLLNTHSTTRPNLKTWFNRIQGVSSPRRHSYQPSILSHDIESVVSSQRNDMNNDSNYIQINRHQKLPAFAQRESYSYSMSSRGSSRYSSISHHKDRYKSYRHNSISGSSVLSDDANSAIVSLNGEHNNSMNSGTAWFVNASPSSSLVSGRDNLYLRSKYYHNHTEEMENEDSKSIVATVEQQVLATLTSQKDNMTSRGNDDSDIDFLKITHQSFLSNLGNIIDLISVISYWVSLISVFCLGQRPWPVFQSLAAARLFRLLVITEGTAVIIESLKSSYDMLKNVMGFFIFFWLLFSLIALFIFTNTFSRRCAVLKEENDISTLVYVEPRLSCSGYMKNAVERMGPLDINTGVQYSQICIQDVQNQPQYGYMSYRNIFYTMLNILTVISTENWTDVLYITQDSVSNVGAAIFYTFCIYLMTFIMVPMFIAVITTSFSHARGDMRKSAFSSQQKVKSLFVSPKKQSNKKSKESNHTEWIHEGTGLENNNSLFQARSIIQGWVQYIIHQTWFHHMGSMLVVSNLVFMSFYQSKLLTSEKEKLESIGRIFTFIFAFEILMRIYGSLSWNQFWDRFRNRVDFVIVIVTLINEIPYIKKSHYYTYLLIFDVLRSYRVAYLFPGVLQLLSDAIGDGQGILNLTFFTFLVLFLLAPMSVQLFGGDFTFVGDNEPSMRFDNSYQAFLALFQIMTGENWTDILYNAMYSQKDSSISYAAIFMVFLYFSVHYMVLNLFIAVIMENFDLDEEEIKQIQIKKYIREHRWKSDYLEMDIIGRFLLPLFTAQDEKKLDYKNLPQNLVAHVTTSRFKEFLSDILYTEKEQSPTHIIPMLNQNKAHFSVDNEYSTFPTSRRPSSTILPNTILSSRRNSNISQYSNSSLYIDNGLSQKYSYNPYYYEEGPSVKYGDEYELNVARENKAVIVEDLNVFRSFFVLRNDHILRKMCLRISRMASYKWMMMGMICITTFITMWADNFNRQKHPILITYIFEPFHILTLLIYWLDIGIHMIADGVFMLPKSYLRNTLNLLDYINLLCQTVLTFISIFAGYSKDELTKLASYIRILSILRSLRIINYVHGMQVIFLDLIYGFPKVIDAVALNFLVFIPFAIYGCFLFNGRFSLCNDDTTFSRLACLGEFQSGNEENNSGILLPRVWKNPYDYSFDTFGKSLLHLFECASGEGWILSLFSAMSIIPENRDAQPKFSWSSSSILHSIFYVVFMFVASLCTIQLFIGVFLEIFKKRNGISSLTNTQRQFKDLQRQLSLIKPSLKAKRPAEGTWRAMFYDLVIDKRGKFARFMAAVLMANILVFTTEHLHQPIWLSRLQNILNGICLSLYVFETAAKIAGLGFYKWASIRWNIYDFVLVGLTILVDILSIFMKLPFGWDATRKLFLVGIAFRLAQRNESLDTLFRSVKRASHSIFYVSFVFGIFIVCFGVIFQEQFLYTRYGPYGNEHANFRSLFNTLLTLFRITTGENWDFLMHDFTILYPECLGKYDCGKPKYAITLFISFYVVCTFIFVNLFTVIVIDNFSFTFDKRNQFTLITRTDLRNFRFAWATVDPKATGYISVSQVPKFLSLLEGVLSVKIYEKEHSIRSLLEASNQVDADTSHLVSMSLSNTRKPVKYFNNNMKGEKPFNLYELNQRLASIDPQIIKQKQRQYTEVYQEILNSASYRGVSFHSMLEILAIRLVDVSKSLTFSELVDRARIQDKVAKDLAKERAKGLVSMLILRRKYLKTLQFVKNNQALANSYNNNNVSLVGDWLIPNKKGNYKLPSPTRELSSIPYLQLGASLSKTRGDSNRNITARRGSLRSNDSSGVPRIVVVQAHQQDLDNIVMNSANLKEDNIFQNQQHTLFLPDRFAEHNSIGANMLYRRNSASVITPTTLGTPRVIRRKGSVSQPGSPTTSIPSYSKSAMSSPQLLPKGQDTTLSFKLLPLIADGHNISTFSSSFIKNKSSTSKQKDSTRNDINNTNFEDVFTQYYAIDSTMNDMTNSDAKKIIHKFELSQWTALLEEISNKSDEEHQNSPISQN
ncbi:Ion transport protein-domain-containing protein [Cokeromyces recurvatus]|uniref:Ion transport protein-domain-containing protein n=1 Tax=Cokeromyces recurvatus TaxID=90255 RepID=UPI00221FA1B5|nr:Ion transport protein-domain-containing protein [Cokeromyces recurvatus]KAI7904858.1 Ion transport protein-domain-containing protein [Cokeromyces recurvatus]